MEWSEQDLQDLKDIMCELGTHKGISKFIKTHPCSTLECRERLKEFKEAGFKLPLHKRYSKRINDIEESVREITKQSGFEYCLLYLSRLMNYPQGILAIKINTFENFELTDKEKEFLKNWLPEPLENEIFKEIEDCPSYFVSNKGRILVNKEDTGPFIKSYTTDSHGYLKVNLITKYGLKIMQPVHRVVATAFIENPNNSPFVDHIDTNRQNNCVENLRWVTQIENMNNELTRVHASISAGGSGIPFRITIINQETGTVTRYSSMSALYRHFNLDYIPKFTGVQTYKEKYTIIMEGEDNDDYLIGKMLRRGNSKEDIIDKVKKYTDLRFI